MKGHEVMVALGRNVLGVGRVHLEGIEHEGRLLIHDCMILQLSPVVRVHRHQADGNYKLLSIQIILLLRLLPALLVTAGV
jgi:hypothetical protein